MLRKLTVLTLLSLGLVCGCRSTSNDRLPATAVDNPDPIFGGTAKLRPPPGAENAPPLNGTPTGQSKSEDRIGPLQFQPRSSGSTPPPNAGMSPGTAVLTSGVKPPAAEPIRDQQIQPAASTAPASSPEVVQEYRQRMNKFGVAGLRTKALSDGTWEAVGHFPTADQPNQLRRIEAQGATEADALLAILEQLEKPQ